MNKIKGLTLIELMVVFIITAFLAMFAIPKYREYSIRAKVGLAVEAINTVNKEIIQQYNDGLWTCNNSTSVTINGHVYPAGSGAQTFDDFPGVLNSIQVANSYGTYSCNDSNNTIATVQYEVVGQGELVCILQVKNAISYQKCGVSDGSVVGQVPMNYLPPGYDCLISNNQTVRGTPCTGFPQ